MTILKLPIFIHFCICVQGIRIIDYVSERIPLGDWIGMKLNQSVERSALECSIGCNNLFDLEMSCNAIIFDASNNVCTRAWFITGPTDDTGLRVAWASSVYTPLEAWFAIDRNVRGSATDENIFHSAENGEKFPWLAVDLITAHKVTEVTMLGRKDYEHRTVDIEIRVGHEKPFDKDTNGDTLYTTNTVCGMFDGPGLSGATSTVKCSAESIGRYVTLQRIKEHQNSPLNWVEVLIESMPVETKKIEILLRTTPVAGQCPSSHPFAFFGGEKCCSTNLENHPSGATTGWEGTGSRGFLNFDSTKCFDQSVNCLRPPCMNYEFQRYGCYMEDADLTTEGNLGFWRSDSPEECEEQAHAKGADGFFWCKPEQCPQTCYPKLGNLKIIPNFAPKTWVAILPCP
jgi:hypothetical protein